jgi:hypothetical protein
MVAKERANETAKYIQKYPEKTGGGPSVTALISVPLPGEETGWGAGQYLQSLQSFSKLNIGIDTMVWGSIGRFRDDLQKESRQRTYRYGGHGEVQHGEKRNQGARLCCAGAIGGVSSGRYSYNLYSGALVVSLPVRAVKACISYRS